MGLVVGGHGVDHEQFTFFGLHHHPGQQFERPLTGIEETTVMALTSGIVLTVLFTQEGVQGAIPAPAVDAEKRSPIVDIQSLCYFSRHSFSVGG